MTNATASRNKKSVFQRAILPVLFVLAGLAILLYPVVSTQVNNRAQEKVARDYEELTTSAPEQELSRAVASAREFNAEHTGGPILDPWLARISADNTEYADYLEQLSGLPSMAQLLIPSIDLRLPIYHGTDDHTLQKGLGHLFGTSLPVGGVDTHSVITGHTGLPNATLFDDLDKVEVGDAIYVSTFGERMKYEVRDIEIVLPNDTDSLRVQPGRDMITLITCTPYGINTHRILVHAERVELDPADGDVFNKKTSSFQWWMWALLAFSLLVIALLAWWIYRQYQAQKKEKHV